MTLRGSKEVNAKIMNINKKLSKLIQILPNVSFLPSNNEGKHFTKHGLHRNKLGKQYLATQIATSITSTFASTKHNNAERIPLPWCNSPEIPQVEEQVNVKRNPNRTRKTPVTKSEDFLW